jgi:hypothetical protein
MSTSSRGFPSPSLLPSSTPSLSPSPLALTLAACHELVFRHSTLLPLAIPPLYVASPSFLRVIHFPRAIHSSFTSTVHLRVRVRFHAFTSQLLHSIHFLHPLLIYNLILSILHTPFLLTFSTAHVCHPVRVTFRRVSLERLLFPSCHSSVPTIYVSLLSPTRRLSSHVSLIS